MDEHEKQAAYPPQYVAGTGPGPAPVPMPAPVTQITLNPQPSTVHVQSTTFGEYPVGLVCPHCHSSVQTRTTYQTGLLTWLVAGALCLFGLFFGCCLIPFCLDCCLDVAHSCPNCGTTLGVFQRLH